MDKRQIKHTRRIFLSEDGMELRAEDEVKSEDAPVVAYFGLHPRIKYNLTASVVTLTLPSGKIMTLKAAGGRFLDKEAFYRGVGSKVENTRIIMLKAKAAKKGITTMRWGIGIEDSES